MLFYVCAIMATPLSIQCSWSFSVGKSITMIKLSDWSASPPIDRDSILSKEINLVTANNFRNMHYYITIRSIIIGIWQAANKKKLCVLSRTCRSDIRISQIHENLCDVNHWFRCHPVSFWGWVSLVEVADGVFLTWIQPTVWFASPNGHLNSRDDKWQSNKCELFLKLPIST